MSDKFNNYLTNQGFGTIQKDYQHANRVYVKDTFARAPKFGFLYFVRFHINRSAVLDKEWAQKNMNMVGVLSKKVDLPKFTISTETLNQYNRKTVVQTGIKYNPVNIDLHDDNTDVTNLLWINYYKKYYIDSSQGRTAFGDTKYGTTDYNYGMYDGGGQDFFDSIDIYVLHQHYFTKYTLINPKIKDWKHDSVDQSATKVLQNSMSIEYENVNYRLGKLVPGGDDYMYEEFYDKEPSPLMKNEPVNAPIYKRTPDGFDNPTRDSRYKNTRQLTKFDPGYDKRSDPATGIINRPSDPGMLSQIGDTVLKNYINQNGLTRQTATAYNIAGSLLKNTLNNGAGKYGAAGPVNEYAEKPGNAPGVFSLPGGIKIDIFKGLNTSVDGSTRVNPVALLFPPKN